MTTTSTTTTSTTTTSTTTTSTTTTAADPDPAEDRRETVTKALSRIVEVPSGSGRTFRVALITLDNGKDHTRPSTFGPLGLASLDSAIDTALGAEPDAIAVTGKPFIFAVGADLTQSQLVRNTSEAALFVALGHRVFGRLRTGAVPTFAFINGAAMGGGMELALQCHYRTLASDAAAVAQPEVFLGLIPGWGGSQLIPRLVGPEHAVTVIVENPLSQNRMLKPHEARELGMVDVVLDAADYLERSLAWAVGVLDGSVTVDRTEFGGATDEQWDAALARGRIVADMRTRGAAPAAYRALELIELSRRVDLEAGLRAEAAVETDLIMSHEFRAGGYAFDLVQGRSRKPVGAPDRSLARPVTKIGVVGAGLMAGQLALLFARRLHVPVVLTDVDQGRLDKGLARLRREIQTLAGKKRISADECNRLTALVSGSLDYAAFADADLVIEAVFEDPDVKRRVFAELEKVVRPDAVLASNTSSLSISAIGDDLTHPERVAGLHFFNPVAMMPLVEVIRGERTDDATLATLLALAKPLRKGPIVVRDAPGFVVNRLLMRLLGEVLAAIDEGTPPDVADAALDPLGLPMRPLVLMQMTGPAVALHVQEVLNAALGERFAVSENLRRTVAAGHSTLLTWTDEGDQVLDPQVAALWVQGDRASTADQVRDRALAATADEARRMLDEGVVTDPADIDLALITGAGFPFWLGGITPYLDRTGISEETVGRRFAPPGMATVP